MSLLEIILISVGLAMDAFAVAVCKGLAMKHGSTKKGIIIAIYFGAFQAIMPLIGYLLGIRFEKAIETIDHWIAFGLLTAIGINMIKESLKNDENDINDDVGFKTMFILALATSIDALAVGVTFAFLRTNIFIPLIFIGIITFVLSFIGVKIGNKFGDKLKNKSEKLGGVILILMGIKILLDHLEVF